MAENLLQNALAKRLVQTELVISVGFEDGFFSVRDDGAPIEPSIAENLLREPVKSEVGLGIGLYHAARQAEGAGYALALRENRQGCVLFSLSAPD